MFQACSSLKILPDISKWNINKVRDMSSMFEGCISLTSIPDISSWFINKNKDISDMFYGCKYSIIKKYTFT